MNATIKRYGISGLIFLAGLLFGVLLITFSSQRDLSSNTTQPITAGSDLFSVLDEEVMVLTYTTDALTLTAQRSRQADRFAVQVTFADGRKAQQCFASPDLAGQLTKLATITANKTGQSQDIEAAFPIRLGTLEIRDRIISEAAPAMEFRATSDKKQLAVSFDGHTTAVNTQIDTLIKLEAGCEALANN